MTHTVSPAGEALDVVEVGTWLNGVSSSVGNVVVVVVARLRSELAMLGARDELVRVEAEAEPSSITEPPTKIASSVNEIASPGS